MSTNALESLLEEGYTTVVFEAHPLACELCKDMDQETWELADFLSNLEHDATSFEHTHVNALSDIRVSGEGLPDILLDYT